MATSTTYTYPHPPPPPPHLTSLEEGRGGGEQPLPLRPQQQQVPHSITHLQYLLKLAHSGEEKDQQKAALELSTMVEGSVLFPQLSFAPMAHALSRLLPSNDRTVVYYSARAIKTLLLDDALRGQALLVGLPAVLIAALHVWHEEVPCLREILGSLQTLSWDKHTVKSVLTGVAGGAGGVLLPPPSSSNINNNKQTISSTEKDKQDASEPTTTTTDSQHSQAQITESGALLPLLALLEARDHEVLTLTTAIIANICAYSDTLLLTHPHTDKVTQAIANSIPSLLRLAQSKDRLHRCYGMAALANASANPVLAGTIKEQGGITIIETIEKENLKRNTVAFGGTRVLECAEVALWRLQGREEAAAAAAAAAAGAEGGTHTHTHTPHTHLHGKKEGEGLGGLLSLSNRFFTFKYGNTPVMELTFDGSKNRVGVVGCLFLWIVCIFVVLKPVLMPSNAHVPLPAAEA